MTRQTRFLLPLTTLSLACATSPSATPSTTPAPVPATQTAPPPAAAVSAAPTAFNPVGVYDFIALDPNGGALNGVFTFSGSPGAYTGTSQLEGQQPTAFSSVTVEGQTVTVGSYYQDAPLVMTLTFTGTEFTGRWAIQSAGIEGSISGKKR
jgi:hypothetical protein